ncbi:MAG: serine hydrolase, partial [Nitrococcus sp.]|nr:serine hydrolase [Nitrococcus sp.]
MANMLKRGLRAGVAGVVLLACSASAVASDALLDEAVGFAGEILYREAGVPGMVIAVVSGEQTAVFGYGETAKGSGVTPDGQTLLRIGSVTKVFTGAVLAHLVAEGVVGFTDPLSEHLDLGVTFPSVGGREIRLIDLATHSAGLPREVGAPPGPPDDPFRNITLDAFAHWLA